MAHKVKKQYTEPGLTGAIAVVVCTCGWKEKALTKESAQARFADHKKRPQR